MAITDWPASERPREKLLTHGAESLTNAELLAIFLRVGTKGKSAVDLSRELLSHFGSLHQLLSATETEFCLVHGMGAAKYAQLHASLEMSKRFLYEQIEQNSALESPSATKAFLQTQLKRRPYEVFCMLFLDNQHRVLKFEELFQGTIDSATVHPREVIRKTIQYNAAAVIFAHNHPSGQIEPSQADINLTNQLKSALKLIEVRVLDHIIVAKHQTTSFAERGLL